LGGIATLIPVIRLAHGEYLGAGTGAVTTWQQTMIAEAVSHEANHYVTPNGNLATGHLIAVQPFTQNGTTPYLPGGSVANVTVINGHYTTVSPTVAGPVGVVGPALGAITMARTYAGMGGPLIMAGNEGKISGQTTAFPWGGMGETCGWDAAAAAVDCLGEADSARAEAWEFMLDLGSAFDHLGYYWNSGFGAAVRLHLGKLRTFLAGLPLRQLVTSPDPFNGTGPTWVNIGPSPYANVNKNPSKYWAALQPANPAAPLAYVLYIHHSVARRNAAGNHFLAFGGYQPIYNTSPTNPQYSESLSLCLAAQSQHYLVQWMDPATGSIKSSSTIPGNTACGTKIATSPSYSYDIALTVSQVP
jgi:hypothetical protein